MTEPGPRRLPPLGAPAGEGGGEGLESRPAGGQGWVRLGESLPASLTCMAEAVLVCVQPTWQPEPGPEHFPEVLSGQSGGSRTAAPEGACEEGQVKWLAQHWLSGRASTLICRNGAGTGTPLWEPRRHNWAADTAIWWSLWQTAGPGTRTGSFRYSTHSTASLPWSPFPGFMAFSFRAQGGKPPSQYANSWGSRRHWGSLVGIEGAAPDPERGEGSNVPRHPSQVNNRGTSREATDRRMNKQTVSGLPSLWDLVVNES